MAAIFFLPDIISGAVVGWRRILALTLVVVIAASMVAQSNAIGGPWEVAKIAATGLHVLATCAWLGGLLALATVLIPGEKVQELDQVIPRFSRVAQLSVVTLMVTGIVHALAVAGGVYQLASSRYGLVLLIKVSIFGLMLLMGNEGRKYAIRAAFRQQHQPPDVPAKNGRHLDPRRGDGSRALHRLCDLVDNLAPGHGGAASVAPAPQRGAAS